MTKYLLHLSLAIVVTSNAVAQNPLSVSRPEADNSVAAELKSFTLADGYEASLFADETDGVANPVCMSWDPAGRLWVLCTWVYPQLNPVDKPDDKLLILDDTDGDGRADKTTVFADGLNMPMGFALGHGGAYIAQGNDLLHLIDDDGDSKADSRRVLLTGFGTGDTHQNVNSLTWSPGGELLFCQGLHVFSRVETPWGIARLDEHGSWRLRPRRLQLHAFPSTGGQNPWGVNFGNWGEPFSKSNGTEVFELLPGLVSRENSAGRSHRDMTIGQTRIKSMIIEFAESPHLPDDIQGEMLIAGYFARDINRFQWETDGAGHRLKNMPNLMTSSHNAFRPVDIRIGPDGAIYIADWFNPIIGHYQASFRHPDRDKTHGRIWRITAKDRPLAKAPDLSKMNAVELCEQLESDWRYVRYQAKRRLADLPKDEVLPAVTKWIGSLDRSGDANVEHHLYEAIGVFESHEVVNRSLLERLLAAKDYRARAYATRVAGRWHDRLESPLELLDRSATDRSARVRLEAVVACSDIHSANSMVVAAGAVRHPLDRFTNFALTQTVHALAAWWRPALSQGELNFDNPAGLIYVLRAYGGKDVAGQVRGLIQSEEISREGRRQLLQLLARVGNANDLRTVFSHAQNDSELLQSLPDITSSRLVPAGVIDAELAALLTSENTGIRASAARLAGLWNQRKLIPLLEPFVDSKENDEVRAAAIRSLAELSPDTAVKTFQPLIASEHAAAVYLAALESVAVLDIDAAALAGLKLLMELDDADSFGPVLNIIMNRRGAAQAVASTLQQTDLSGDDAKLISRWLSAAGHDDSTLINALKTRLGIEPGQRLPYDVALVRSLAGEVRQSGDVAAGKQLFLSSLANCTACHRIQDVTTKTTDAFPKGPDLTAVAAGLQLELIIESVIWPKRQIKEGYEMTTILTDDGRTFSGYLTSEDAHLVGLRDLATGKVREIPVETIEDRVNKGTAMPSGFTNSLTRNELRDLIAWLASLKGGKAKR